VAEPGGGSGTQRDGEQAQGGDLDEHAEQSVRSWFEAVFDEPGSSASGRLPTLANINR
jgi:hypothetical protein